MHGHCLPITDRVERALRSGPTMIRPRRHTALQRAMPRHAMPPLLLSPARRHASAAVDRARGSRAGKGDGVQARWHRQAGSAWQAKERQVR